MAPIREGWEDALRKTLQAMAEGDERPFGRVGSTHFARFVVIPALLDGDGEAVSSRSYLLFGADFDGCRGRWLRAVARRMGPEIDRVLGHCEGYPGSRRCFAFRAYIRRYSVGVGFSVISYEASVRTIRDSLELRAKLRRFVEDAGDLGARDLRARGRELQRSLGRRFAV